MTFVQPLLLAGLFLVGLPILIHLLMRPRPKRLPFPAFRFLVEKKRSNQRSLKLRHLLLLLLRMAILAALCLALARPKLGRDARMPGFSGRRPVDAVLLVDTSPSMDYSSGGRTWLDEARRRALEVLEELPHGSRIALLDSADVGGEWSPTPSLVRERLTALKTRHEGGPLTRQLEQAYRLFAAPDGRRPNTEAPPRVLFVFSDRTQASWDETAARSLTPTPGLTSVFVDVGSDETADLAVTEVRAERATVRPGETAVIQVTIQATGADFDTQITCVIDGQTPGETRPLKLAAGRSQVLTFERPAALRGGGPGLTQGPHQVEVRLAGSDPLVFNNAGFATFHVLEGRRVLVLTDAKEVADGWVAPLSETFRPEVKVAAEAGAVDFAPYQVVCLVNVARPDRALWDRLKAFVAAGGGLAVVPGGEGWKPEEAAYGDEARDLLPGRFQTRLTIEADRDRLWTELEGDPARLTRHPFLAPFRRWRTLEDIDFLTIDALKPRARRAWKVQPDGEGVQVVAQYQEGSPALLERTVGRGRVLMLTTSFDRRRDADGREWNNYFELSSFGLVLTNLVVASLAGDDEEATLNYPAGQTVPVPLPARPFFPRYVLTGPGLTGSEADLSRAHDQMELRVTAAVVPGNFGVVDGDARRVAAFSIQARPEESQLSRVPVETLEAVFGSDNVLPAGRSFDLSEVLAKRWAPAPELAPALFTLLLAALAVEVVLANRFYRRPAPEKDAVVR